MCKFYLRSKLRQRRNDSGCDVTTRYFCLLNSRNLIASEISEKYGYYIIQHGSNSKSNGKGRTSGGVAINLSSPTVRSWIAAGSCVMHFGYRILAVKLEMEEEGKTSYSDVVNCLRSHLQVCCKGTLSQQIWTI